MPELRSLLEGAEVELTCQACPSQWEGTLADGRHVYVRFRFGVLSVGLGATVEEARCDETFREMISDGLDGFIRWEGVLEAVEKKAALN